MHWFAGPAVLCACVAIAAAPVSTLESASGARAQDQSASLEARALENAITLAALEPGVRVVLIEPDLAPDPEPLRRLDAFIVRNADGSLRPVIYVNYRSGLLREAAAGSSLHIGVLAAVLHHEARHLSGASETEARRAELAFFNRLISLGKVPADLAHRYLQLLKQTADVMPGTP